MTKEQLLAFVDQKKDEIREHVDSVRIFVTFENEDGNTTQYSCGGGNWYAQRGQVEEWIEVENGRAKEFHSQPPGEDEEKED